MPSSRTIYRVSVVAAILAAIGLCLWFIFSDDRLTLGALVTTIVIAIVAQTHFALRLVIRGLERRVQYAVDGTRFRAPVSGADRISNPDSHFDMRLEFADIRRELFATESILKSEISTAIRLHQEYADKMVASLDAMRTSSVPSQASSDELHIAIPLSAPVLGSRCFGQASLARGGSPVSAIVDGEATRGSQDAASEAASTAITAQENHCADSVSRFQRIHETPSTGPVDLEQAIAQLAIDHSLHFNALQSKLTGLRVDLERLPEALDSYSELRSLLFPDSKGDMPPIGGWAATAPTVCYLSSQVLASPKGLNVLELGSGTSTIWIALAMKHRQMGHCWTLESDPDFAELTRSRLQRYNAESWATVIDAPIADGAADGSPWYDLSGLPSLPNLDILFVDGPPAKEAMARYPAFGAFREKLSIGGRVVLDDTIRTGERTIFQRWASEAGPGLTLRLERDLGKSWVGVLEPASG